MGTTGSYLCLGAEKQRERRGLLEPSQSGLGRGGQPTGAAATEEHSGSYGQGKGQEGTVNTVTSLTTCPLIPVSAFHQLIRMEAGRQGTPEGGQRSAARTQRKEGGRWTAEGRRVTGTEYAVGVTERGARACPDIEK